MSEWKPYTGTDEQIGEMRNAEHGVLFEYVGGLGQDGVIYKGKTPDIYHINNRIACKAVSKYLICNPHPLADMIELWAWTGQPVWIKTFMEMPYAGLPILDERIQVTNKPDWNIPGAEYSFAPF